MDDVQQQHRHGAEGRRAQQADPAIEVEAVMGIIPPADGKTFLQDVGRQIFQCIGDYDACKKQRQQIALHIAQREDDQERAKAINRTERPRQKAAVDQFALTERTPDGFIQPAHKAVDDK